jgi:hypothetical protein
MTAPPQGLQPVRWQAFFVGKYPAHTNQIAAEHHANVLQWVSEGKVWSG